MTDVENALKPESYFFADPYTKTTNWVAYHQVKQDVLLRIIDIVAAHNAEIAFPTSTVHVANGALPYQNEPEQTPEALTRPSAVP